jgi:hypothetical protein
VVAQIDSISASVSDKSPSFPSRLRTIQALAAGAMHRKTFF